MAVLIILCSSSLWQMCLLLENWTSLFTDFHAVGCIWTEDPGRIWTLFREELDTWGWILCKATRASSPVDIMSAFELFR